ncbi:hypothetical protein D3C73_1526430 [compost metagenome]
MHIEMFRQFDLELAVFPFREGVKQVTFTAQKTKCGLIKAYAVTHQRDHTIGQ